jgi:hypothetical protein
VKKTRVGKAEVLNTGSEIFFSEIIKPCSLKIYQVCMPMKILDMWQVNLWKPKDHILDSKTGRAEKKEPIISSKPTFLGPRSLLREALSCTVQRVNKAETFTKHSLCKKGSVDRFLSLCRMSAESKLIA